MARNPNRFNIEIDSIAHHRNGIAGAPFHAVAFRHDPDGRGERRFVATVFRETGCVAMLDTDLAAKGEVSFGENSWRGDQFEPLLRNAIRNWEDQRARRRGDAA